MVKNRARYFFQKSDINFLPTFFLPFFSSSSFNPATVCMCVCTTRGGEVSSTQTRSPLLHQFTFQARGQQTSSSFRGRRAQREQKTEISLSLCLPAPSHTQSAFFRGGGGVRGGGRDFLWEQHKIGPVFWKKTEDATKNIWMVSDHISLSWGVDFWRKLDYLLRGGGSMGYKLFPVTKNAFFCSIFDSHRCLKGSIRNFSWNIHYFFSLFSFLGLKIRT